MQRCILIVMRPLVLMALTLAFSQTKTTNQPNQKMSHEEGVVRTTYARLAFASQVNEVHSIMKEHLGRSQIKREDFQRRMQAGALQFTLSNFKVGPLSEIAKIKYSDLVTKPSAMEGDSLSVAPGHFSYNELNSPIAIAHWMRSPDIKEDWDQSFGTLYAQTELAGQHDRYATFSVHVAFEGRSRDYRAMFLFGTDKATGKESVFTGDMIIDIHGGALSNFVTEDVYPETLIEGGLGKDPVVREWLNSGQVSGSGQSRKGNCDPIAVKCGVHSEDLKKLDKPLGHSRAIRQPRFVEAAFRPSPSVHAMLQAGSGEDRCGVFNNVTNLDPQAFHDSGDHILGQHAFGFTRATGCKYTDGDPNSNGNCNTTCTVDVTPLEPTESGVTISGCHKDGVKVLAGFMTGTGDGAKCNGGAGGAVKSCIACICGVNIKIEQGPVGVTVTSDGFYTVQSEGSNNCSAQKQPVTVAGGGGGGGPDLPPCDPAPTVDGFQPVVDPFAPCMPSPIIIDTEGEGFQLTSAAAGVIFDIRGDGHPIRLAWTAWGSHNAFLALDRDGSGTITSGKELFGNFTAQPASAHQNGFLALAEFDKPENGGNGDGVIDEHDAVFPQLRLWIDLNHDGVAQHEELHSLSELGVFSLALDYHDSRRQDQYGNQFRYKARVNPLHHDRRDDVRRDDGVGRNAYDVFFVTK